MRPAAGAPTPPRGPADDPSRRWPHLALVLLLGLASLHPAVPSAAALSAGVAVALLLGNPAPQWTAPLARRLLPAAVVALGAGTDLLVVGRVGARGVGYTVASIAACLALGALLTRALRVDRRTGLLVTVGTAICGGSAIAAVAPVVRADDREVSVALGTVFVLNALALVLFPPVGRAAGLDEAGFGLWAALAIHDTSSVVGAALQYGPLALTVGTTVKLARALWIAPVALGLAVVERRRGDGGAARLRPPWFIAGFVAAAALATSVPALAPAASWVAAAGRRALVLVLFLIGLGLSRESLRAVGPRPLVLGAVLWIVVAAGALGAVALGLRAG